MPNKDKTFVRVQLYLIEQNKGKCKILKGTATPLMGSQKSYEYGPRPHSL